MSARREDIPVPPQAHGARCATFLAEHFPTMSPVLLDQLFRSGRVRVNGRPSGRDLCLNPGDVVSLPGETARRAARKSPPIALDILHENELFAVLNKPPGLVMEPGAGHRHGTLRDALLAHYGEPQRALGSAHDFGLVHRLDRDTSGVLLVAKTVQSHEALVRQFAERLVQKTYLALVSGRLALGARLILKDPLKRTRSAGRSRIRTARRGPRTMSAETIVRPLEEFQGGACTLVEASPRTGRTHQIRVHLANAGAPILGDSDYGDPMANSQASRRWGLPRIFLHAQRIRFVDPVTHHPVEVEAELPKDLAGVVHRLESGEPL